MKKTEQVAIVAVIAVSMIGAVSLLYSRGIIGGQFTPMASMGMVHLVLDPNFHYDITHNGFLGLTPTKYTVSGALRNDGSITSGPATIQVMVYSGNNTSGPLLYTTTTTVDPIRPGDTGYYIVKFTSDDLGGTPATTYASVRLQNY